MNPIIVLVIFLLLSSVNGSIICIEEECNKVCINEECGYGKCNYGQCKCFKHSGHPDVIEPCESAIQGFARSF
uniref:Uncharacterized protein n=1 Tax=Acrobeloides nanus TaxID=290746 RepID=A0A914CJ69_9BILA